MTTQPVRGSQAVLGFLLLALAGCFGGDPGAPATLDARSAPGDADFDDSTGALRGYVISPEALPLAAVDLRLSPGGHATRSGADGAYLFGHLAPGRYVLEAQKIGYTMEPLAVTVRAGEPTQRDVPLSEVRVDEARSAVLGPFLGYIQCRWASTLTGSGPCGYAGACSSTQCTDTRPVTDLIWTQDHNRMEFRLDAADWTEIVFEARWTPSTVATNAKMENLFSHSERLATHLFGRSNASDSPLKWTYVRGAKNNVDIAEEPLLPDVNHTLITWMTAGTTTKFPDDFHPAAATYELRYELMVTVFYSSRAPEGYTGFDAA